LGGELPASAVICSARQASHRSDNTGSSKICGMLYRSSLLSRARSYRAVLAQSEVTTCPLMWRRSTRLNSPPAWQKSIWAVNWKDHQSAVAPGCFPSRGDILCFSMTYQPKSDRGASAEIWLGTAERSRPSSLCHRHRVARDCGSLLLHSLSGTVRDVRRDSIVAARAGTLQSEADVFPAGTAAGLNLRIADSWGRGRWWRAPAPHYRTTRSLL
jgi:hypothetical protein